MSWVQEEWKDGLNQKVLIKISALENQNEKLKKEAKQKQFQLESLDAALNKQKKRADEEKSTVVLLKRENQALSEACAKFECKIEKFNHELRSKETFARHLEDQLNRCKAQIDLSTNKTPKHHQKHIHSDEESLTRIKDLEAQLAFQKTHNTNLERELSDLKKTSSRHSGYRSSLPWAIDDYTSPVKPKQSFVDLLTGSPLAGGGDALLSLNNNNLSLMAPTNVELETLKEQLDAAKKQNHDLSARCAAEVKTLQSELLEKNEIIKKLRKDVSEQQLLLDEAGVKISDYDAKVRRLSEELSSERHHTETSKSNFQTKLVDQEKAHKQDLSRVNDALSLIEDELRKNKREMGQDLSQCHSDLHKVQAELSRSNSSCAALETELKRCKLQIGQLEQLKQQREEKSSELAASLKKLTNENASLQQCVGNHADTRGRLQDQINSLSRDIKSHEKQVAGLEQHLALKEKELLDVKEKAEHVTKNQDVHIDSLKSQLEQSEAKRKQSEKFMRGVDEEVRQLTSNLAVMEKRSVDLSLQLERLQVKCTALSSENQSLTEKDRATSSQLDRVQSELEEEKEKNRKAVGHNEELNSSWAQKLASCQASCQEEVASLLKKQQQDVECLEAKIKSQENVLRKLNDEANTKEEKVKMIHKELQTVKSFAEKLKSSNSNLDEDRKKLEHDVDAMRSNIFELQTRLKNTTEEHTHLLEKHQALEEDHALLTGESKENFIERQYLEGRVQDAERQVETLQAAADSAASLRQRVDRLESDKLATAATIKGFEEKLLAAEMQKAELQQSLEKCERVKQNIAEELKCVTSSIELRISEYERDVSNKNAALESIQQAYDALQLQKQELDENLHRSKSLVLKLEDLNHIQEERVSELMRSLDEKNHEMRHLASVNKLKCEECDKLSVKLGKKAADCADLRRSIKEESDKLETLRSDHDQVLQRLKKLEESATVADHQIKILKSDKQRMLEENNKVLKNMEEERSSASSIIELKSAEVAELTMVNSSLKASLSDLQSQMQDLTVIKSSLEAEIFSLQSQLLLSEKKLHQQQEEHEVVITNLNLSLSRSNAASSSLASDVESLKLALENTEREKSSSHDLAEARMLVIQEREKENADLEKLINELKVESEALRASLEATRNAKEDLDAGISKIQQDLAEKTARMSSLLKSRDDCAALLDDLRGELELKRVAAAESEAELKLSQHQVDLQCSELSEMRKKHLEEENLLRDALKILEDERDLLNENLELAKQNATDVDHHSEEVSLKNKELTRQLSITEAEVQKLTSSLELLQMDLEDRDESIKILESSVIAPLRATLKDKEKAISFLTSTTKDLEGQLTLSYEKLDVCLADKDLLHERLALLIIEHNKQTTAYDSLDTHMKLLQEAEHELLDKLEVAAQNLQTEIDCKEALQARLDLSTVEINKQNEEFAKIIEDFNDANNKYDEVERKRVSLEKELLDVKEEKNGLDEKIKALELFLDEEKSLVKSLQIKNKELQHSTGVLHEKYENKVKACQEESTLLRENCEKKIKSCEDECEELHSRMKQLRKMLRESESQASNLESLSNRLCQDNTELRLENETLLEQVTVASKTIIKLEDQLNQAERNDEEKNEVVTTMQSEREELIQSNASLKEENEMLNEKVTKLAKKSVDLETRASHQDQLITEYEAQVDDASEKQRLTLIQLDECQLQLNDAICKVTTWQEKAEDFQKSNFALKTVVKQMKERHEHEQLANHHDLKKLQDELADLKQDREVLQESVCDLQNKEFNLLQSKEKMNQSLMEVTEHLQDAEAQLEKCLSEKEELSRRCSYVSSSLSSLRITTDDQIKGLSDVIDQLRVQLRYVKRKKSDAEEQLKERIDEMQVLGEQMSLLTREIESCLITIKKLQVDNYYYEQRNNQLNIEFNKSKQTLLSEINFLQCQIQSQKEENDAQCYHITELIKDFNQAKENIEASEQNQQKMQKEVTKQRKKNAEMEENVNLIEDEILSLRSVHKNFVIKMHNLEESKSSLISRIEAEEAEHCQQVESLNNQVLALTSSLEETNHICQSLQQSIKAKDLEIEKTNKNLKNIVENLEAKMTILLAHDVERCKLKSEVEETYKTVHMLKEELVHCKKDRDDLKYQLKQLACLHEETKMLLTMEKKHVEERDRELQECGRKLGDREVWVVDLEEQLVHLQQTHLLTEEKCKSDLALLNEFKLKFDEETSSHAKTKNNHETEKGFWREESLKLKSKIDSLNKAIDQWKTQSGIYVDALRQKEKEIEEMKEENKELSSLFDQSVVSSNQLQDEVTRLTIKLTDNLRDSQVVEEKYQTLSCENENIAKEKHGLHMAVDSLQYDKEELQSKLKQVSDQLALTHAQHCQSEDETNLFRRSVAEMEEKLTLTTLKHASEISSLEEKLRAVREEASHDKMESEKFVSLMNGQLEAAKLTNSELEQQLAKVESDSINKGKKVAILKHKLKSSMDDIAHLSMKHQHQCSVSSQLQLDFDKKSNELTETLNFVSTKDAELKEVRDQIESSSQEIDRLQNSLDSLQLELQSANERLLAEQNSNLMCKREMETLAKSMTELEEKCSCQSDELSRLNEEKLSLVQKERELTCQFDDVTSRLRHSESELSCTSENYQKQINDLENKICIHEEERSSWCDKEESLKTDVNRLTVTINEMQVKMNEDEEKWKDSLKKIDELESSEKNHLSTIAASENEVKELRHKHDFELDAKQKEMDRLQSTSSSLERESASLRRCLEEKEEEVDTLSKSLSLVEVELASSQALMQELTGEMEALKKKNEVEIDEKEGEMVVLVGALQRAKQDMKISTDKCEQLQSALQVYQLDFDKKSNELTETLNLVSTKDAELKEVRDQIESSSQEIDRLQNSLDSLQLELQSANERLLAEQNSNLMCKREMETLAKSMTELEEKCSCQSDELSRLNEEKLSLVQKERELTCQFDDVTSRLRHSESELSCTSENYQKQINDLENKICIHEEERSSWCDKEESLKTDVNRLTVTINEMQVKMNEDEEKWKDSLKTKEVEMNEKEGEVVVLRGALQRAKQDMKISTDKYEQLQSALQVSQLDFDKKSNELTETLNLVSTKDAELKEVRDQIESSSQEIDRLQNSLDSLQLELQSANERLLAEQNSNLICKREMETLAKSMTELEEKCSCQSDELSRLNEEKLSLVEKERKLTCQFDDVTSRLRHSESELSCTSENYQKQINDLENKICIHEEERSSWCDKEESLKTDVNRLTVTINEMQVKMNEDEEKWKDSLKKIDELESSEKNHLSTIAASENEVKELRHKHDFELDAKQKEMDRLQSTSSSLERESASLRRCLEEKEEEVDTLSKSLSLVEVELASSQALMQELTGEMEALKKKNEEEYSSFEEDLKRLEDSCKDLSEENEVLVSQIKLKEKQYDEITRQLSVVEAVLAETSETNAHMKDELSSLKDVIKLDSARHRKRVEDLRDDNEKLLERFHALKKASKLIQEERNNLSMLLEESTSRINEMRLIEEELSKEKELYQESSENLEKKNSLLEINVKELKSSLEEMETTLEEVSIHYGDLEEKWKDTENLLEETSLAMDDLRMKLDEEREKVNEQQQTFAENESKSRELVASLHNDVDRLEDKLLELEEEKRKELRCCEMRESEMEEHTRKLMEDFSLLNSQVISMEEEKTSLEAEIAHLRTALDETQTTHEEQERQASRKLNQVLLDVDQLRSVVKSSDAERSQLQDRIEGLEEELQHHPVTDQELAEVKLENKMLKTSVETLRGKLTLMTTTAKRKEKELHRVLEAMNGKPTAVLSDQTQTTDSGETVSIPSKPFMVKRSRPKRSSRKSSKREKVLLPQNDDINSIENSPQKILPSRNSSSNSSPLHEVEGLPHLVKKGFTSIPHGLSSPFVLRRQQLSTQGHLPSGKPGGAIKQEQPRCEVSFPNPVLSMSDGGAISSRETRTNLTKSSPQKSPHSGRQLRLGLSKSPSKKEDEVECKVQ